MGNWKSFGLPFDLYPRRQARNFLNRDSEKPSKISSPLSRRDPLITRRHNGRSIEMRMPFVRTIIGATEYIPTLGRKYGTNNPRIISAFPSAPPYKPKK